MNEKIFKLLNNGQVKEVLLGENEFFIPNHTYTKAHNRLLVLQQMLKWADTPEKLKLAEEGFYDAVNTLARKNIKEAFRLILGYCLAKNQSRGFVDEGKLLTETKAMIASHAQTISADEGLREIVLGIEEYLPHVRS